MKATKKAPEKKVPPTDDDGFLCLKGDRLWKWRALDAEFRTATIELDSLKMQIQAEIAKHLDLVALMGQQASLYGAVGTAKAELATFTEEIAKEFDVDLKHCAFDDRTGRLYNLKEDGERGEPIQKKTSLRRRAR